MTPGQLSATFFRPDKVMIIVRLEFQQLTGAWDIRAHGDRGHFAKDNWRASAFDWDVALEHFLTIIDLLFAQECILNSCTAECTQPGRYKQWEAALLARKG